MNTQPPQRPGHAAFWIVIGSLLALGIPWYRTAGTQDPVYWGLPLWAVVALASALGISIVAQWGITQLWDENPEDGDE